MIVFVLISLTVVNAADSNQTNQMLSENDQNSGELGNFTDLNNEISKIQENGNFTLKKDYRYDSGDSDYRGGIIISKDNIVIDGDGHTIDGAGQARIFNITSNNVTLKNINFLNGYSEGNGSAIYTYGNLNSLDSIFFNNTAVQRGGAIYVERSISDFTINSTFINNTAYQGGAIYFNNETDGNIIDGYFEGNRAERIGGAICFQAKSFNNLILADFYSNWANVSGGAIFFRNVAENNKFKSVFRFNYAVNGGGIFFYNKTNNNLFACDFSFNVANSSAGAIAFFGTTDNNNFTGCFINNSALAGGSGVMNGNGGAITFRGLSSNCLFVCDFINNTAFEHGGALNYRQSPVNITFDANFINNAAKYGGGINFYENFENINFKGEFRENCAIYGGAIVVKMGSVENVNFTNNSADYGGAIYFEDMGNVFNSNFTNNIASDGGAILACGNLTVNNSIFENNMATSGTNHISLKENAKVTLSNVLPENIGPFYISNLTIIDVKDVAYGNPIKIPVNISYNGIAINEGNVSVVINNKTYSADIINGNATIEIPNLEVGEYNCYVVFESNENYTKSIENVSFKIEKQNIVISADNNAYLINYDGKYSAVVRDINNKLLSGINLTFTFDGKNLGTVNTDSNGVAVITLTSQILKTVKAGIKNLDIVFAGTNNYNSASKTVNISINKENTKIVAKKKTFKKAVKVKKYAITLKNSKGKAVNNVKVTLKVKGKTFNAKTNSKGKAIFKIKKLTKKGKNKATVTYKGNDCYNKATKKVNIIIK